MLRPRRHEAEHLGGRMLSHRVTRRIIWVGWGLLLSALSSAWAGPVEVITNKGQADGALDRQMVRALFTLRLRQWPDGSQVRVFVLPDANPLHVDFCRNQLGTFPYVLRASWDRLVFTGTGIAPEIVANEKQMRERVAATPGAIGYVSGPESMAPNRMVLLATLSLKDGDTR